MSRDLVAQMAFLRSRFCDLVKILQMSSMSGMQWIEFQFIDFGFFGLKTNFHRVKFLALLRLTVKLIKAL